MKALSALDIVYNILLKKAQANVEELFDKSIDEFDFLPEVSPRLMKLLNGAAKRKLTIHQLLNNKKVIQQYGQELQDMFSLFKSKGETIDANDTAENILKRVSLTD